MIYEFTPTQDLHGYSKPWAPGACKNLIPITEWFEVGYKSTTNNITIEILEDGGIKITGGNTASGVTEFPLTDIRAIPQVNPFIIPAGTYTVGFNNSVPNGVHVIISGRGNNGFAYADLYGSHNTATSQVTDGTKPFSYILLRISTGATYNTVLYLQVEEGSTASAYEPYANICIPEGYDIWDPTADDFTTVYAGYVNSNTRELYLRPVYKEYDGEELVGPWMSSMDEYSEDATPTEGAFVIDFGGELTSYEITAFMLQTLLDSLGIRQHFLDGASLLNSLMDQAQGRVRSEEELLNRSLPLKVITIGDQLPTGLTFRPISKDVLPGLPGKFIR